MTFYMDFSTNDRFTQDAADIQRIQAEDDMRPQPTAEQIRDFIEAENKSAAERLQEERNAETCKEWVSAHPEYLANAHSRLHMTEFIEARSLPVTEGTLSQAFEYLSEKGFISTNKEKVEAAVQKQLRTNETLRRARAIEEEHRASQPTEAELRSMPLEQLRNLALTGRRR
jgi:hypothetical protein